MKHAVDVYQVPFKALARCVLMVLPALMAAPVELSASTIHESANYPPFSVGVTGVDMRIEPGRVLRVDAVDSQSDAADVLKPNDIILAANDQSVTGRDPRVPLGQALTQAEEHGSLGLTIIRDGERFDVEVDVPVLGAYSDTWPLDCDKSQTIIDATARNLVEAQQDNGWYEIDGNTIDSALTGCMATLFLLSTGDEQYMPTVERFVSALAARAESASTGASAWHAGYQGILLAEYYLKTGDEAVLPGLENLCRIAAESQVAGSWGHSLNSVNPGYVQSGLMNSAGLTVFQMLALARECGITVSEDAFQQSRLFFWRMTGHGSVCYGDHRAEIHLSTNGRNAKLAATFALFDAEAYQLAAAHLAMMVADSYDGHELGHTGGGFNVMWRTIGIAHLPEPYHGRYRRHMDALAWYYDLCRLDDGGFRMLPSAPRGETRYTGRDWGFAVAMTYTAPRQTLRITGAARTEHSVDTPPLPELPWGTERDLQFLRVDHAEGFGQEHDPPHVIQRRLAEDDRLSVDELVKFMHHFNPVIRTWAARRLRNEQNEQAYQAIVHALEHHDVRVRRAACDAISGYDNWGPTIHRRTPREIVSEYFVPHLERILHDDEAALWEIDGALWAMGHADAKDIRRNADVIQSFAEHDEWYIREAAYWALIGVGAQITGDEFLFLADFYLNSEHVYERSSYDSGIGWLLNNEQADLDQATIHQYIQRMGPMAHSAIIAAGYEHAPAHHEATHRMMMTLSTFEDPPYHLIIDHLVEYMDTWEPDYQHSAWLVTGNNWQPGLIEIADRLGDDARPLIEAFERSIERVQWDDDNDTHSNLRDRMKRLVDRHEDP